MEKNNGKTSILVVDDLRSIRLTLGGILEDKGHKVVAVENGYQAIEAVRKTHFDVIFMDIKMPGINGVQTFREVKKIDPKATVIMMTAYSVEDLVKEALEEGAYTIIYKPFDIDKIIAIIEELLHEKVLILVVDDQFGDRETLKGILEDKGYRVAAAKDGTETIEMIKSRHYDIIFLDVRLPDMNGVQVFEQVKEIGPQATVIMMTGYASMETAMDAVNQGAYAYFVKPVNPDEIKTTIANAIKQQQLSLENKRLVESLQHSNKLLFETNEELKEANQAKSDFLASMSHDLRTPLNVIIGFSELMRDEVPGEVNKEQKQCLDDILSSSKHLLTLIDGVLDLSKVESGKMELNLTKVALAEVIESLRSTMVPILTPRKQSLEVEVEDGLPPVRADKVKLRQVLFNLLSNSTKFTPDGGKLKIEAVREGNRCQVSVIDNGVGIKKEDQERVFEPFYQLDNPLTKERGGTGLGLALVKQIVEKHGRQVWVESEYGKGSRFTFTLPLAVAD